MESFASHDSKHAGVSQGERKIDTNYMWINTRICLILSYSTLCVTAWKTQHGGHCSWCGIGSGIAVLVPLLGQLPFGAWSRFFKPVVQDQKVNKGLPGGSSRTFSAILSQLTKPNSRGTKKEQSLFDSHLLYKSLVECTGCLSVCVRLTVSVSLCLCLTGGTETGTVCPVLFVLAVSCDSFERPLPLAEENKCQSFTCHGSGACVIESKCVLPDQLFG